MEMGPLHLTNFPMDTLILSKSWDNACLNVKIKCLRVMNNLSIAKEWREIWVLEMSRTLGNSVFWILLKLEIFRLRWINLMSPYKLKETPMGNSTWRILVPRNHNQKITLFSTSVSNSKFKMMTWLSLKLSILKLKVHLDKQI